MRAREGILQAAEDGHARGVSDGRARLIAGLGLA